MRRSYTPCDRKDLLKYTERLLAELLAATWNQYSDFEFCFWSLCTFFLHRPHLCQDTLWAVAGVYKVRGCRKRLVWIRFITERVHHAQRIPLRSNERNVG